MHDFEVFNSLNLPQGLHYSATAFHQPYDDRLMIKYLNST